MDWVASLFLLLISTIKTSALDLDLFPPTNQWLYSYHAKIRTGTLLPAQAHSQWDLYASIHITSSTEHIYLHLSDLRTSSYNGPRDGILQEIISLPLPEDVEKHLSLPFFLYPSENENQIGVSGTDPLWSVNIKRAIVSALQLDLNVINKRAALGNENGVHGLCKFVEYSTVSNMDYVYVRKVIDRANCNLKAMEWSSAQKFPCVTVGSDDAYSASTTREYTLARKNKTLELRHINSSSRLYVQPFNAAAEAQHVYQYQEFRLNASTETIQNYVVPNDLIKKPIQYEYDMYDLTHGRAKMHQETALTQTKMLLDKLVGALDEHGLGRDAGREHSRALTQLYYKAFILDLNSLRRLYRDIGIGTSYKLETTRNMFLELLPQIGTKDSVHFMKELIVNGTVKDLTAIKLLAVFPFYVRQHSKEVLDDMSVLLDLGDNYDASIRQTAVLSFATLVFQTHVSGGCSVDVLDHYARKYYEYFSQSTTYEKKMLYLQGLDNLQLGSVFEYLNSIVQSPSQSRHVRFLAVWASMLTAPFRPANIYEIYWPILVNRTQHLEMRVAAFTLLLITQPTKARFLTLYWYMQGEPDPHLYRFFYTTLISLQKTTYPCYAHLGQLSKHIARFIKPPTSNRQWVTGNYLLDYTNTYSGFGGMAQLFLVGDPRTDSPNVIYLTFNNYANGKSLNQAAVYLKIHGLPHHLRKLFSKKKPESEASATTYAKELIEQLQNAGVEMLSPDEMHLEFILKVQGKTIFCQYFNNHNLNQLGKLVSVFSLLLENHMNYQSIFLPYLSEYAIPSDTGTLLLRGIVSNSVASVRGNATSERIDTKIETSPISFNLDLDLRYYTYTTNFLEAYNPIWNHWHGAHESRSVQGRILFNGTLLSGETESALLLGEEQRGADYISAVMHSHTATYILGENATIQLKKHCNNCSQQHVVHKNEDVLDNERDLFLLPLQPFGTKLHTKIFDCESFEPQSKLFFDVYSSHRSNAEIIPISDVLMYGLHVIDYVTYIMPHGSCGVSFHLKPYYKEPTELQLKWKWASLSSHEAIMTLSHRKLPDGPDLQFWNASVQLDLADESTFNLTIKHTDTKGEKQMMCVNMEMVQPHKLSLKPANSVVAQINSFWSPTEDSNSCPANGSNINSIITSTISDKQKHLEETSQQWPYKECRERNFNQSSVPCYLTAKKSYKKFTLESTFKNMPKWLQILTQRVRSLMGATDSKSEDAMISKLIFTDNEPNVILKIDDKNVNVNTYPFKFINDLQFLVHNDWNSDLGFNKMCIVSTSTIWTSDNRTVSLKETQTWKSKKLPLWAECLEKEKSFGVFLDKLTEDGDLAVTMYAGSDIVTVRLTDSRVLVTVNDTPLTNGKVRKVSALDVWRYSDQLVIVNTRKDATPYHSFTMRYTRDYLLMEVLSSIMDGGRLCGICAPNIANHYD